MQRDSTSKTIASDTDREDDLAQRLTTEERLRHAGGGKHIAAERDPLDEASMDSFPASDPPAGY